jgi:hypothetical protein
LFRRKGWLIINQKSVERDGHLQRFTDSAAGQPTRDFPCCRWEGSESQSTTIKAARTKIAPAKHASLPSGSGVMGSLRREPRPRAGNLPDDAVEKE